MEYDDEPEAKLLFTEALAEAQALVARRFAEALRAAYERGRSDSAAAAEPEPE